MRPLPQARIRTRGRSRKGEFDQGEFEPDPEPAPQGRTRKRTRKQLDMPLPTTEIAKRVIEGFATADATRRKVMIDTLRLYQRNERGAEFFQLGDMIRQIETAAPARANSNSLSNSLHPNPLGPNPMTLPAHDRLRLEFAQLILDRESALRNYESTRDAYAALHALVADYLHLLDTSRTSEVSPTEILIAIARLRTHLAKNPISAFTLT